MDRLSTNPPTAIAIAPSAQRPKRGIMSGRAIAGMLGLILGSSAGAAAGTFETPYLAEIKTAMDKMMAGMDVAPTGDIDADFVAMMEPHHQGAIDMAIAELRYGTNERLKRIAQEIIVDQQQEIAAMRLAIDRPLPPSEPVPTRPGAPTPMQPAGAMPHHMQMEH